MSGRGGCLACGGRLTSGPGQGWGRCRSCGSWRRIELPTHEELYAAHQRLYFSDSARHDMTGVTLLSQYVSALSDHVSLDGRRVLDVGAGTGEAAPLVRAGGALYAGLESSEEARLQLSRHGSAVYADPEQAAADGPFDAALLVEVVEHLLDPKEFLAGVRNCLRPGAMAYLTTPNAASLHGRLRGGAWWAAALPAHVALYTTVGLDALFAKTGFQRVWRHRRVDYGKGGWHQVAQTVLQGVGMDGGLRVLAEAV